jgi:putative transposase
VKRRKEFIAEKKSHHATSLLCRVVGVSNSSWYRWQSGEKGRSRRLEADAELTGRIEKIWDGSRKTYGSPRVHRDLRHLGIKVSRKRVARLMGKAGIYSHAHRKYPRTTIAGEASTADLVRGRFFAERADELWVTDITQIRTDEGWLYLSAIEDMATRKIVGYAMAEHLRTPLPLAALNKALKARRPQPGLIHHSDKGCQYTSGKYQNALAAAGIRQSMGAKGASSNAPAESLWASLKKELIHRYYWQTRYSASRAVHSYIRWYNSQRLHSSLDYLSPDSFEQRLVQQAAA